MQLTRKIVTSDPFVVYGYYEILKKEEESAFTTVMNQDSSETYLNVNM